MKSKSVKINIPEAIYESLYENAQEMGFSPSEYINYLIYKENYLHLSVQSKHKEKVFEKYYERFSNEVDERDIWKVMFNVQ